MATCWWKKQEGSLGEAVGHFSIDSPKAVRTMLPLEFHWELAFRRVHVLCHKAMANRTSFYFSW